jgi:hypothetical protein
MNPAKRARPSAARSGVPPSRRSGVRTATGATRSVSASLQRRTESTRDERPRRVVVRAHRSRARTPARAPTAAGRRDQRGVRPGAGEFICRVRARRGRPQPPRERRVRPDGG